MTAPIVFLSDFGWSDPYVGQVKGVIHKLLPQATVIDLYHDVPSFDRASGAFVLEHTLPHFPKAVWLCVVDPGVGSQRRALAVLHQGSWFLGPDNGLLAPLMPLPNTMVWEIHFPQPLLAKAAATFHGRDLFAPAAVAFATDSYQPWLGQLVTDPVLLPDKGWSSTTKGWRARVMLVDRYGNLITSLPGIHLPAVLHGSVQGKPCGSLVTTFSNVAVGSPALLVGGYKTVEVVVNQGNAAQLFAAGVGSVVEFNQ